MMMKKLSYLCLLLFLLGITTTRGQNGPAEARRTAEEQAAFEKSVPVNPAKIAVETQVDPGRDPVKMQVSPTNWKPAATPVDDRKTAEPGQSDQNIMARPAATDVTQTQPGGAHPGGKTLNYREVKGTNTQPESMKAGRTTNYRDQKGVHTQPEGKKPD